LFGSLIAASFVAYDAIESLKASLGPLRREDAAQFEAQLEAVRGAGLTSAAMAFLSVLVGMLTPVNRSAA
jgi:hypothetical protein